MKIGRKLRAQELALLDGLLLAAHNIAQTGLIEMRQSRMKDDAGTEHLVCALIFPDEILQPTAQPEIVLTDDDDGGLVN